MMLAFQPEKLLYSKKEVEESINNAVKLEEIMNKV